MDGIELSRSPPPPRPRPARFALLAVAVALAGAAGYVGYVAYPRFDLPAGAGAGVVLLAAGAGVASFFSPCSFPLLLTLLGREVEGPAGRRGAAAMRFAAAFSAGAVVFLLLLGALIGAGGGAIARSVTFTSAAGIAIRITVGTLLVVLGLAQAEVLPISFHGAERLFRPLSGAHARLRRRHPVAGSAAFGFAYLLIGFG